MYQMNDHAFRTVWGAAQTTADKLTFVSEWSTSSLFLDPEDDSPIPQDLIDQLGAIFDAANMPVKQIRAATGMTQVGFAEHFCIPRRTLESWETDSPVAHRDCPDYLRLLLLQAVGILQR